MKTINNTQQNNETNYFEVIATGERLYGLRNSYDAKVDLSSMTYISIVEQKEYAASNLPTINDLIAEDVIRFCDEVENLTITASDVDVHDFDAVVAFAKSKGFNIERAAIEHNHSAWKEDYKSGYRGSECHCFTPCGCNSLRYDISKLDNRCDWQETYFA